jgi:membrane protein required for colicin V production
MQTYDIIMLVVIAAAMIFGAIKGFAWQVASLASIIASYFIASYFRHDVAKMINAQPPWNMFLAMLLLYFGSSLVIWMVFRLVSTSIDKIRLKEFDRQLGAGFGLIKGAILCCVITMFAMTLLGKSQQQSIANSRSGHYISKVLANADGLMPVEVKEVIGPYIDNVERQLEQGRGPGFGQGTDASTAGGVDAWGRAIESQASRLGNEFLNSSNGGSNPSDGESILGRLLGNRAAPPGQPQQPGTGWQPDPNAPWNVPANPSSPSELPGGWPVSTPQNTTPQSSQGGNWSWGNG